MDDSTLRQFFLQPNTPRQRQYEALRAVFVEGLAQQDVAARFGYSYQAFRQLVHSFRQSFAAGAPPFSTDPGAADRAPDQPFRAKTPTARGGLRNRKPPMSPR
jgi:hypothetical protein